MFQLNNTTPFQAGMSLLPNEAGIDTLYVIVKATFVLGKEATLSSEQRPVTLADEYWGAPGLSSLKYASESHLTKLATDLILVGEACAPGHRPVTQIDVTLAVADQRKTVRVFGDRLWEKGFFGHKIPSSAPFERMPLIYERAFGGVYEDPDHQKVYFEPRNPIGCGFMEKKITKNTKGIKLPNLEDPAHLIEKADDHPPPAGFGFIAPAWEPRKSFAGTYDESWQKTRAPFLPKDFNARFFNMAPSGLVCNGYLKGGEPVEVINASANGPIRFQLPICQVEMEVLVMRNIEKRPFYLETVLIEPSASILCMTWRAALVVGKQAAKVAVVIVTLNRLDQTGRGA